MEILTVIVSGDTLTITADVAGNKVHAIGWASALAHVDRSGKTEKRTPFDDVERMRYFEDRIREANPELFPVTEVLFAKIIEPTLATPDTQHTTPDEGFKHDIV